jgi:hypothetical protein
MRQALLHCVDEILSLEGLSSAQAGGWSWSNEVLDGRFSFVVFLFLANFAILCFVNNSFICLDLGRQQIATHDNHDSPTIHYFTGHTSSFFWKTRWILLKSIVRVFQKNI